MKKNLGAALKSSLANERDTIANKQTTLAERLEKAETIFEDNPQEKFRLKKKRVGQGVKKDTFTFPQNDYLLIKKCKDRALEFKFSINKSEILRAALILLDKSNNMVFLSALESIVEVKQGRPKQES